MTKQSTRLTRAEIDACIRALEFVLAGEIDAEDGEAYEQAARSASNKLKDRLYK